MRLVEETPCRFRIERRARCGCPAWSSPRGRCCPARRGDQALQQVANVATLPGIVEASYAMPDVHWGYGFPIGGVAATDVAAGGVVSPGGVGFDISCGVRLLRRRPGPATEAAAGWTRLMDALGAAIPRGMGRGGVLAPAATEPSWTRSCAAAPGTRWSRATACPRT